MYHRISLDIAGLTYVRNSVCFAMSLIIYFSAPFIFLFVFLLAYSHKCYFF